MSVLVRVRFACVLGRSLAHQQALPSDGCSEEGAVACLFTDDWFPSGYIGPGVQTGVPTIAVFRSKLGYNTQGVLQPISEFAAVTAASRDIVFSSSVYATGLGEYATPQSESYDFDWRDPDTDGLRAVAAGWPSLGHWALPCTCSIFFCFLRQS